MLKGNGLTTGQLDWQLNKKSWITTFQRSIYLIMVLTGGVLFVFSFCLPQLSAREPSCAGCYIHTVQKEHLAIEFPAWAVWGTWLWSAANCSSAPLSRHHTWRQTRKKFLMPRYVMRISINWNFSSNCCAIATAWHVVLYSLSFSFML